MAESDGLPHGLSSTQPTVMTKFELQGDWNLTKLKLKQNWAQLTEGDLQFVKGRQEELMAWIQQRTGQTRAAIEHALNESCASCCA